MVASMEETTVKPRTFEFGGHALTVLCRRDPEESAKVTITLQMTVEEVWDSFWDFSCGPSEQQPQQKEESEQPPPADPPAAPPAAVAERPAAAGEPRGTDGGRSSSSLPPPDEAAASKDGKAEATELLGLDVWPAAVRLCEYLSRCPQLVEGQDVAELGAGMGLPGLLCTKLGARHVLSSDYVEEVVAHLRSNGERNGLAPPAFEAVRLDWTDLSALQPPALRSFRVLLLADVLYQSQLVGPLVGAMLQLLHPQGVILLGHLPRRAIVRDKDSRIPVLVEDDEPYHIFRAAAERAGLHARVLSDGREQAAAAGEGGSGDSDAAKQRPLLLAFALDPQQLARLPPAAPDA